MATHLIQSLKKKKGFHVVYMNFLCTELEMSFLYIVFLGVSENNLRKVLYSLISNHLVGVVLPPDVPCVFGR